MSKQGHNAIFSTMLLVSALLFGCLGQASAAMQNWAIDKNYTYNLQPDANYPDSGGQLTDGVQGSETFRDAAWVASKAAGPWVITLDLETLRPIGQVQTTFLRDSSGAVFHPTQVTVAVSKDGQTWTDVDSRTFDRASLGNKVSLTTTFNQLNIEGRFVRVTTEKDGQWMFISEIAVLDKAAAETVLRGADDLDLIDHGLIAQIAENRGVVAMSDSSGHPYVVAAIQDNYNNSARNALLVIDAYTGKTDQYWYKQGNDYAGDLFALISASNGKIYTMFGPVFLEFDLDQRQWTFAQNLGGLAMSFAEGVDGKIYCMRYPTNNLVEFDPKTRQLVDYGRLDPVEKYAYTLAVDQHGWVYAGIGTENSNVVAYHPATREMRQLTQVHERKLGSGVVQMGQDGQVYGRMSESGSWYRLENGARHAVQYPSDKAVTGAIRPGGMVDTWANGDRIMSFSLSDRVIGIREGYQMKVRAIRFEYESEGPGLTSLVAGPEGLIHGSTAHPMRYFTFDPVTDELHAYTGLPGFTGGNIANFAVQGDQVVGGAYNGGFLYRFDTTKAWNPNSVLNQNPVLLAKVDGPIARPRPTFAHPDGEHVIMAGFPGYGYVGGGMLIYNIVTNESTLFVAEELFPGHSTMSIRALPDGNLIAATSVATPGGGQPTASEAKMYIMDWDTKKIIYETEPLALVVAGRKFGGAREINSLEVDAQGLVYGISSDSQFFVFDPVQRRLVHRASLSEYGAPFRPDQTLFRGADGQVYALTRTSLLRFDPTTFAPEQLAEMPVPVTAGTALLDGRLYFGSGSKLWSISVKGLVN